MSSSLGAGLILLLVVLSLGVVALDLPTVVSAILELVLILAAVLIGSRINRRPRD
jgi:hypothetical protein